MMKPRWLLIAILLGLLLAPSASSASNGKAADGQGIARTAPATGPRFPVANSPASAAAPARPQRGRNELALARGEAIGRAMTATRLGVAVAALMLIAAGRRVGRAGEATSARRRRRIGLVLLASIAFGASYNFFQWRHYDGIHAHEVFHYYLGAKYFPELGYFDLYECAVVAATEGRPAEANRAHEIRDLRRIHSRREIVPARSAAACHARFSEAHWAQFKRDTEWIKARLPGIYWKRVITDQGLNASPVWILVGRPMAWLTPAEGEWMKRYVRLDVVLVLAAFGAAFWAFGIESAALVVIAWAANPLSRYEWVGDAPLRQMWFTTALIGLCLLARQRAASAGAFLAASSLLRIFPLFYSIGYALWHLRAAITRGRPHAGFIRFAASGLLAGGLLIAAAVGVCGRGPAVLGEFASNIETYANLTARNSVGLRTLLSHSSKEPVPTLVDGQLRVSEAEGNALTQRTFDSRRGYYWAAVALFGWLFWRALPRVRDWEAACMGFAGILLFTQAAGYYMTCTVPVALLAIGRPRIAYALLGTLAAWSAIILATSDSGLGYVLSSGIALSFTLFVLVELGAARPTKDEGPSAFADGPMIPSAPQEAAAPS